MNFSHIQTKSDVAKLIGTSEKNLNFILYRLKPENMYFSFQVPKKNGGFRTISKPEKRLMNIQKTLSKILYSHLDDLRNKSYIHNSTNYAFEEGKSIYDNAYKHRNKKYLLSVDILNYFDTFHFGRILGFFKKNKFFLFGDEASLIISQLVTYNGSLPQGAPTSPIISIFMSQIIDSRMVQLAKNYRLNYSRYADDISFSTNMKSDFEEILNIIEMTIKDLGFSINKDKTRLLDKHSKQLVTGLITNEKVNIQKDYYRKTRAMLHNHIKYQNAFDNSSGHSVTINQILGRLSFILYILKRDENAKQDKNRTSRIVSTKHEIEKLYFHKLMFINQTPIIFTEGKTDHLYLKAFFKKNHEDYPKIVSKIGDRFEFKVQFFHRSNLSSVFIDAKEGAPKLSKIIGKIIHKNANTLTTFEKILRINSNSEMSCKIIFIFDHELGQNKPLNKLLGELPERRERLNFEKGIFRTNINNMGSALLCKDVHLVTTLIKSDEIDTEIESMLPKSTLTMEIEGKRYMNIEGNTGPVLSKERFSKYIYENYNTVEFGNLYLLANRINAIV